MRRRPPPSRGPRSLIRRVRRLEATVATIRPPDEQRRASARRPFLGLLLLAVAIMGASWLLLNRAAGYGPLDDRIVGFATPVVPKERDRSFYVSVRLIVKSCGDPVDVSVLVTGTAEFWKDWHRKIPNPTPIGLAVIDDQIVRDDGAETPPSLRASRLDEIADYFGAPDPRHAGGYARAGEFRRNGSGWLAKEGDPADSAAGFLSLASIRNWGQSWAPVAISFKADWLEPRGLRSCYLQFPTLVGYQTTRPVDVVEKELDLEKASSSKVATSRIAASVGRVEVITDLDISPSEENPAPVESGAGRKVWRCFWPPSEKVVLSPRGDYAVPSVRERFSLLQRNLGCNVVVALNEAGRDVFAGVGLLLIGAAAGLGLQFAFEALTGRTT